MTDRWVDVAPGVFVRRNTELDLSVGLVVGDGGCLVVDTRGDAAQGAELAAAVRDITDAPWTVGYTHGHFDHCFGTAAFDAVDVWAQKRCREGAAHRDAWARRYRDEGRADIAARIAAVEPLLPNRLVTDRAVLRVGGRVVELIHFGPGHTDHDLVVWIPDAGVAFAGDLVEQGAPPSFGDAFPAAWPVALDGILGLASRVVVPEHGDPVDAAFVAAQRAELATVAELCASEPADAVDRSPCPAEVLHTAIARTRLVGRDGTNGPQN